MTTIHPHPPSMIERFQSSLSLEGTCLRSKYATNQGGYVLMTWWFEGKRYAMSGHRLAFYLEHGWLPDGKKKEYVLDHLCRNRWCCNPAHLEVVTQKVNMERGAHATKTHCAEGHEFNEHNTLHPDKKRPDKRVCRICNRERTRKWRQRKAQSSVEGITVS